MKKSGFKKVIAGICCAVALIWSCAGHAASVTEKPEVALRKAFPGLTFDSVEKTDIQGMYEVISGTNIFYYFPEKDYLFAGEIYTPPGKNITAEKKIMLAATKMKSLPLDKAVKSGNGKTVVIEFTDPDCPYCRKAYEFLKNRTDITRYTFFTPLAHPAAITKVYYILNSEDKVKAYHEMFEGKSAVEPPGGYSDAVKKLAQEHLDIARAAGVNGTPTFYINGKLVVGADLQQIQKLLGEAAQKK